MGSDSHAERAVQTQVLKENKICNTVPTSGGKEKKVCISVPDYSEQSKETLPPEPDATMDVVPAGQVNLSSVLATDAVFEAIKHIHDDEQNAAKEIQDVLV